MRAAGMPQNYGPRTPPPPFHVCTLYSGPFLEVLFASRYFFKMAGSGLAPAPEDVRLCTVLWSGSKHYVCLFTATELSSCIALFEITGNLESCTFLRWL